ncbi:MAG: hypothetical protein LBL75_01590 [Rickettsiales bacterium]|jgi:predicted HNH restriction endonuclease|nr:hypothetical protein [Rickettsiales bacterium]
MSEKQYKIITTKRQFSTDYLGHDYLKSENDKFYVRENKQNDWEEIKSLDERKTPLKWWNDNCWSFAVASWIIFVIVAFIFGEQMVDALGKWVDVVFVILLHPVVWLITCTRVNSLIESILEKQPSYFVNLSDLDIQKIIDRNKPYVPTTSYRSSGSRYTYSSGGRSSGGGGSGGRSYGGSGGGSGGRGYGGSGGGYSGDAGDSSYIPPLVSYAEYDSMLKKLESNGTDWGTLANKTTDEEREKLFANELGGDSEKGKFANEKFERESLSPSRKSTLQNYIDNGEFEDDATKESLQTKLNSFDGIMKNDDFQKLFREIKSFQERKKKIDSHVKYEGRLSNKDIKQIKEHLGYICMGCELNPAESYGDKMATIIEAHHKTPYSELEDGESREVKPDDFLMLCPTCHRMIHKLDKPDDLDGLKEILNKKSKSKSWFFNND